ncbi:kinesin-domain-containing protein [Rhizopus microsporus var. microsporus]|uniref:Kinesin-like protein n=1 Tax=Rhizopus microsporus var. microsporus TaxID=86635 RepID=A0A1X0QQM8_RHIZD|nr:kinesin-domain-containing protein [Rhizopus microsporus var. microsporus]
MVSMIPPADSNAYRTRNKTPEKYRFTKIFNDTTDQQTFFNETTLPLIQDALDGNNALIFAYGVTNSGKTYTVMGKPEDPGLVPRSLSLIFNSIDQYKSETKLKPAMHSATVAYDNPEEENRHLLTLCNVQEQSISDQKINVDTTFEYGIWISFIEVYNEQIFDLLDPTPIKPGAKRNQLHLKYEQRTGNKYVADMNLIKVKSTHEAHAILSFGQQNRRVFSTAMNQESSRSHSIFTIHIVRCPIDHNNFVCEDPQYAILSKLSFVDLAGSERYRNTLSSGQRLKEAGNINKSLMFLGQCMEMLRLNQMKGEWNKSTAVIPYRHSKLTEMFKSAFEGDGKAAIIVNFNPFDTSFDENSHVMKFSAVAKDVTTVRQLKTWVDPKNIKSTSKRPRVELSTETLEQDITSNSYYDKAGEYKSFLEDLISKLEEIKKEQSCIDDIRNQAKQEALMASATQEQDIMQRELEKLNTDTMDDQNVHNRALLNRLLEKQKLIIEEMNTLKSKAEEERLEKKRLMEEIRRLQEGQKNTECYDSISNKQNILNPNTNLAKENQKRDDEDSEYSRLDPERDGLSDEDEAFASFLRLRKQLRRSIFKKDVLCEDTDAIMKQIEAFEGVTFDLAKETKMGKLLKVIASEKFEKDPFQIRTRAFRLFKKYAQLGSKVSTPQSPLPTTIDEANYEVSEDNRAIQELQEENLKLKRQIKSIEECHLKLSQITKDILNRSECQGNTADNERHLSQEEVGIHFINMSHIFTDGITY